MDTLKVDVINISELGGNSILGVSLDALISVFITIIVFSLGLYFAKKRELKKRYKHLKYIEKYIYVLIEDLKLSIDKRVESFESLITQLKEREYKNFKLEYISDYSMEFIMDIDWLDLFSVFTELKKEDGDRTITLYKEINRNLASIRDINKLWLKSYDELNVRQTEYMRRWDNAIENIGKKTDDFVLWMESNKYKKGSNAFVDEMDNISGKHQKTKNAPDIFIAIDSLINPLHTHIKQHPKEPLGRAFLDHVMACKYAYRNFIKNRDDFIDQFGIYISKLNKSIKEISKYIEELKSLEDDEPKFKQIWKL